MSEQFEVFPDEVIEEARERFQEWFDNDIGHSVSLFYDAWNTAVMQNSDSDDGECRYVLKQCVKELAMLGVEEVRFEYGRNYQKTKNVYINQIIEDEEVRLLDRVKDAIEYELQWLNDHDYKKSKNLIEARKNIDKVIEDFSKKNVPELLTQIKETISDQIAFRKKIKQKKEKKAEEAMSTIDWLIRIFRDQ